MRGNRQVKTERTRQGKGGPVTETQRVYWTFAIRLGEPLAAILRIWQDEKLVYDARPESVIPQETEEFAGKFRFYTGAEDQLPDPDLEAFQGVGDASAYPGTAYVVFPILDLTDGRKHRTFVVRSGCAGRKPVPIPVGRPGSGTDTVLRSIAGGVDFDESFTPSVDAPVGGDAGGGDERQDFPLRRERRRDGVEPGGGFQAVQGLPTSPAGYRAIMCGFWRAGPITFFRPTTTFRIGTPAATVSASSRTRTIRSMRCRSQNTAA